MFALLRPRLISADLTPTIPHDEQKQAIANLAIDMFNLNWSMLDADIALTKSFHGLIERISYWTQGDGLSAAACLRAASSVTELLGAEERVGDVMLAIQVERLALLAALLETGLDAENDQADSTSLRELLLGVKRVLENVSFPPLSSLRHAELPPLHRPVLRILFLLFQSLAIHPKHDLQLDTMLEEAVVFIFEAADIILDSVLRGHDSTGDLGLVIGSLCGMIKVVPTPVWLDKMSETNLIGRSLEIVTRTKVLETTPTHATAGVTSPSFVPSQIPLVLLLHLALATNPSAAEKLAVSGVLSAYSDNSIALAAETASIVPPVETAPYTIHGSWYSMLLVVKALLSSLHDTRSFIRSDVTPFIRVGTEQMIRALTWNGETPLTTSALDEMQITLDIFYGISQAVSGGADGILSAIGPPIVDLLKGMREAFEHPLELTQTISPSSEDEHVALEQELGAVLDANRGVAVDLVTLLDEQRMPTVSGRVERLLVATSTAAMTLVNLTRVWPSLKEGERNADTVLHSDVSQRFRHLVLRDVKLTRQDEITTIQNDPVGIVNDLGNTFSVLLERIPTGSSIRPLLYTLFELTSLLSTAQILTRHTLYPDEELDDMDVKMGDDSRRRTSLNNGGVVKELTGDLMTLLGGEDAGSEGVLGWLRRLVWRTFEQPE